MFFCIQKLLMIAAKQIACILGEKCFSLTHHVRLPLLISHYRLSNPCLHSSIPGVLAMPAKTVTIDLPALQLETRCEVEKGVHKLIRDKFSDVVQKWFRQVPSNPDYYFYCPETPVVSML